jgi:hypothetical protein
VRDRSWSAFPLSTLRAAFTPRVPAPSVVHVCTADNRWRCRPDARHLHRPVPTGSPAVAHTIGMTDVAFFDAITAGVPDVT